MKGETDKPCIDKAVKRAGGYYELLVRSDGHLDRLRIYCDPEGQLLLSCKMACRTLDKLLRPAWVNDPPAGPRKEVVHVRVISKRCCNENLKKEKEATWKRKGK
jgi:hypothetical protein